MTARRRLISLCLALAFSVGLGTAALEQVITTTPPVQSVNNAQGAVLIPTVQRQVSAPLDASQGSVTWSFPTAFTNPPTCYESLVTTSTGYSFDDPVVTTISTTAVSLKIVAHPTSLTITSLTLPIVLPLSANPPAGTTVTLTCVGSLP